MATQLDNSFVRKPVIVRFIEKLGLQSSSFEVRQHESRSAKYCSIRANHTDWTLASEFISLGEALIARGYQVTYSNISSLELWVGNDYIGHSEWNREAIESEFNRKRDEALASKAAQEEAKQKRNAERAAFSHRLIQRATDLNPELDWTLLEGDQNKGIGTAVLHGDNIPTQYVVFTFELLDDWRGAFSDAEPRMRYELRISTAGFDKGGSTESGSASIRNMETVEAALISFIASYNVQLPQ